jgi:group II intron reverse transcriptase/maturase
MHNFNNAYIIEIFSIILVIASMSFWFRECAVPRHSCHERPSLYPCLNRITAARLGLQGKPEAEHSILVKTNKVGNPIKPIIDSWAVYSMVRAILLEAKYPLALNQGHYHYGEGVVHPEESGISDESSQAAMTRCKLITLKDMGLQPKEYVWTTIATTGSPKGSNSHGDRVFVVGLTPEGIQPRTLSQARYYSTSGTNSVMARLEKLYKRSADRPNLSINQNLHSLVYKVELLTAAYQRIKSKPGNMTPACDDETLDGISHEALVELSELLRTEKFNFRPARRVEIPKANGGSRPLSIAPPRDKIVQEAIRMILEAIYEPLFKDCSHGFRPNRSCHTALKEVKDNFKPVTWIIEGDISKCFDSIDHGKLMDLLESKINDRRFTNLIRKSLKAGYFSFKELKYNIAGTPQGSIVSPILANIFLHQLDEYILNLKKDFDKGTAPLVNPKNSELHNEAARAKYHGDTKRFKEVLMLRRNVSYVDFHDPEYKRLVYVRYADDWLIGIRGSHNDAVRIKYLVSDFCNQIGLKVSDEKTKITNISKDKVLFLGTHIFRSRVWTFVRMPGGGTRRQALGLIFEAPLPRILKKLANNGFMKSSRVVPKYIWVQNSHRVIVALYNSVVRGYLNYYSFVHNYGPLVSLIMRVLKVSCAKLLAAKYSIDTTRKVYQKFGQYLTAESEDKKLRSMSFIKPSYTATHRFSKSSDPNIKAMNIVTISQATLEGLSCQVCGSQSQVEMHYVRMMKDLNPKAHIVDKIMARRNRKQIPLCRRCHVERHRQMNEIRRKITRESQ